MYGALALGVVCIYAPVRRFEFVSFDDPEYVTDNPVVERGLTADGVAWAFGAPHASNWHPLTWLSHMLDVELFGLDAGAHHVTNVVLHLASALLLFRLLTTLTARAGPSAFVAMVFAFHPLRVESVAWVSERKDVLSTLLWTLTLLAWVGWIRRGGAARWVGTLTLYALGLLAKPMLVTLPVVLVLLDYWPLRRLPARPSLREIADRVREKLAFFVLAALAAGATLYAQRSGGAVVALEKIPPAARVANALVSYVRYVAATVYPAGLAIFYPYRPWPTWVACAAGIALAAVSALAVASAPRRPYLLVGWLWYLVTLLPVIGLVQVGSQAMADRFTYVPQIGLAIAVAWGLADTVGNARWGSAALATSAVAVVVACGVASAHQVRYWHDTEALFGHALAVTRDNYLAHLSLGEALGRQGRLAEAREHYFTALRLNPASAAIHANVGNVYAREGRTTQAEAEFREAVRLKPDLPEGHNGLGLLHAKAGDLDGAIEEYRQALAGRGHYAEAHVNLGNTLRTLGRFDEAAAEYRAALTRHADWADAHYGLAVSLGSVGDLAGAEREYRDALRYDPELAEAYFGLGLVLQARGAPADAVGALRDAVRLAPDWPLAAEALAWLLATGGDGRPDDGAEAVRLAEAARSGAGADDPRLLDTLGAAYAANGRFADAAVAGRRAAALARERGDDRFAADVETRVALYQAGRAVRSGTRVAPR